MFDELYNTVKQRYGSGAASQSMSSWIALNTSIKRKPFGYNGYEFQRAIADDMHTDLSVKKCSQVGLTEVQLRKFLAILTRNNGLAGIFSLPNERMFTRVYNTRLKPLIEQDDIFNPDTDIAPVRRRDTVQIRDSFGYITGCTESDATSTPADFLMHDELDLSPATTIGLYQSRLQNSDMRMTQKFSTPTFVGFGIDRSYALSDQREYMARCGACNHWQIPTFTTPFLHIPDVELDLQHLTDLTAEQVAQLDLDECYVRCEKCHRRLELGNPELREWIATYPGRTAFRGYQVRPFSSGRLNAGYVLSQLAKYLDQGFIRGFYNTVTGEPFNDASAQVQRADVEACMQGGGVPDISRDVPVFLGIDIGFQCYITLSYDDEAGTTNWVLFETVPVAHLETRIQELRKIFNIVGGAADRFPFTPTVDALRDATNRLVMPVQYRGAAVLQPIKDELGMLTHYSANQTLVFDRILAAMNHRKMVLRGYGALRETVVAHLCDMVRDESPDAEASWKKTSGQDHFFHSMAINLLSRRICEHMYQTQSGVVATFSGIIGATFGENQPSLLHDMGKVSRLGEHAY